jgi:hypothetical protein
MVRVKVDGAQYRAVPDFSNSKCEGLIRNLILTGFEIRQKGEDKGTHFNSFLSLWEFRWLSEKGEG